jgi:hypothetical protein
MKKIYHFVGSTLPVNHIVKNIENGVINIIYAHNTSIYNSYIHLRRINSSIYVKKINDNLILYILKLLFIIINVKLKKHSIRIYHELGLHFLDIIISTIKPKGEFHPQSHLGGGWREINFKKMPKSVFLKFLINLRLIKRFQCYEYKLTNGTVTDLGYKIKEYPASIKMNPPSYFVGDDRLNRETKSNNILFIVGRSYIDDILMKEIFLKLVVLCTENGFQCSIKDHPNIEYRLNINYPSAIKLDPSIPSELIVNDYDLIVGSSSTSLLASERSISIIYLLKNKDTVEADGYRDLLENIAANRIQYVTSFDEFILILNEYKNDYFRDKVNYKDTC